MEIEKGPRTVDGLLEDVGGCGRFQFVVASVIESIKLVSAMSMMMMSFGNYNPGWRCLDNSTASDNLSTPTYNASSSSISNITDDDQSCSVFESCSNVKFTPGISTVVSEWHLVCDKSWIPSFIISLQMAGLMVGGTLSGYLADKFGRKKIIYGTNLWHLIFNVVALFSNSWQYFAAMRFLIGMAVTVMANLSIVYAMEFAHRSWRNVVECFPVWATGCLLFAVSAMFTENWRYLHVINAVGSFITLIPYFWMPESLRWLLVNDRTESAQFVVKNIAKLNRKNNPDLEPVRDIANLYKKESKSYTYSFLNLMQKGLRYTTVSIGILFICFNLVFYSISFGVKSLPGNFYTNLIIMYAIEIPQAFIISPLPNYTGRKKAVILLLSLCTVSLFTIVALDRLAQGGSLKSTGILVGAMFARLTIDGAWDVTLTFMSELYPTLIRSTVFAYSGCVARIGGIAAPYLITDDPDSIFINYLSMAVLSLVCCVLLVFFPETRGRPMPDIQPEEDKLRVNVDESDEVILK